MAEWRKRNWSGAEGGRRSQIQWSVEWWICGYHSSVENMGTQCKCQDTHCRPLGSMRDKAQWVRAIKVEVQRLYGVSWRPNPRHRRQYNFLFQETATSPTAIIALQLTLWFGLLADHIMTCSDAVQAFLQTWLDKDAWTLVILPVELWRPEWKTCFRESARLALRLHIRWDWAPRTSKQFHLPMES